MNSQPSPSPQEGRGKPSPAPNPDLPRSWIWLFYFILTFGVVYICYAGVLGMAAIRTADFDQEWQRAKKFTASSDGQFEATIRTLTPSKDPIILADGKGVFLHYCAPCHRQDGGGMTGPNLCDEYWIHGSNFVDNVNTIYHGVPRQGMVTWRGVLKPSQIYDVASYIYTLRGTHPPSPKEPEGVGAPVTGAKPKKKNIYE